MERLFHPRLPPQAYVLQQAAFAQRGMPPPCQVSSAHSSAHANAHTSTGLMFGHPEGCLGGSVFGQHTGLGEHRRVFTDSKGSVNSVCNCHFACSMLHDSALRFDGGRRGGRRRLWRVHGSLRPDVLLCRDWLHHRRSHHTSAAPLSHLDELDGLDPRADFRAASSLCVVLEVWNRPTDRLLVTEESVSQRCDDDYVFFFAHESTGPRRGPRALIRTQIRELQEPFGGNFDYEYAVCHDGA